MPQHSAGILLYRMGQEFIEVLLVHPGGPHYSNKEDGVWSIPKGLTEENEEGLVTAKREFLEELGIPVPTERFIQLTPVRQKGGKIVHAWAGYGNIDAGKVVSNRFKIEYRTKVANGANSQRLIGHAGTIFRRPASKFLPPKSLY